jgi:deoxyinosine 3'endonuclease (endonuclease V)
LQTLLQLVLVVGVAKSRLSGGVVRDFRALGNTSLLILEIDVFGRQQVAQ